MADEVEILSVRKLDEPPREPGADKAWWEIIVGSDEGQHTLHAWVSKTAEIRLPVNPDEQNEWVREEVEKLGQLYDNIDVLYALQPLALTVPLD